MGAGCAAGREVVGPGADAEAGRGCDAKYAEHHFAVTQRERASACYESDKTSHKRNDSGKSGGVAGVHEGPPNSGKSTGVDVQYYNIIILTGLQR